MKSSYEEAREQAGRVHGTNFLTILCDKCGSILYQADDVSLPDQLSVSPCGKCRSDEVVTLRRERGDARHAAERARSAVLDHRRAMEQALSLALQCVDLEVPPIVHDDATQADPDTPKPTQEATQSNPGEQPTLDGDN